ncbi:MAG TPA: FAD-binding and (Fe-S)-binding domain-containing protein [Baekduia sp.]|nr:FAD-binding and (Fe-S)-binding domain-containing protein [Baekduia sp.]
MSTIERIPATVSSGVGGTKPDQESVDVGHLKRQLEKTVKGEVRFDAGTRAIYANDSSNFRQIPLGVVIPKTVEDVEAAHRACAEFGAPIVNRGGGTSLSGETVNRAVVIDCSKYLRWIGDVDAERKTVRCQPGAINEHVNMKTGSQANLIFGPDPSTHDRCTIGGNLGNNSCGIHSVQAQLYGPGPRFSDCVRELEVVTYDGERFRVGVGEEDQLDEIIAAGGRKGEIYAQLRDLRDRYADLIRQRMKPVTELPRRVSGFNLDELLPERGFNVARALIGTESTCATFTEVEIELMPAMLDRVLVIVEYEDLPTAGDDVEEIIERFKPIGLEGLDKLLIEEEEEQHKHVQAVKELPRADHGEAWLLVQFGADSVQEAEERAHAFRDWCIEERGYAEDRIELQYSDQLGGQASELWEVREGGLGATAFPPGKGDAWPGWEDSAVPPTLIGPYLRDLRKLFDKYGLEAATYGHFGQGCVHCRIPFDLRHADGIAHYRRFLDEASDLVIAYGGSLSGEHGDGQQRAAFLEKQYGPELVEAFREFKRIWDPEAKMNPGKVVDPFPPDSNMKLGVTYNPPRPDVKFAYQHDGGDFAHATMRCVGVGKCRVRGDDVEQVMCPSYQVTNEEQHSTRGRARMLWEMLQGEVITDGWQSKEVYDALDLCLSCKGCTNDCPVNVDMPTYKSEFLYHHYKSAKRWRPRYAYAFGLIDQAARVASKMPGLVNFVTQTPPLSRLAKLAAGMDAQREIPTFAPITLQEWFRRRAPVNPEGPRVILFPDTFNNHFHTDVGVACVEALEAAGWQVVMPEGHICCGRPLYDYGFLDLAERYLHHVLDTFREDVRAGTPIVGMEPSCLAVFKDELKNMLPNDDDADRLQRCAYHWSEFFIEHDVELPQVARQALLWGHCHHKATGGMDPEQQLLEQMGLDVDQAQGGCCGLAGSWGFETGKHDISMACGEQGFLPAVRDASDETVVVANGFSCKTQLQQSGLGRRALHAAQVMKLAREHGPDGWTPGKPEEPYYEVRPPAPADLKRTRALAAGGAVALAAGAVAGATRALRRG